MADNSSKLNKPNPTLYNPAPKKEDSPLALESLLTGIFGEGGSRVPDGILDMLGGVGGPVLNLRPMFGTKAGQDPNFKPTRNLIGNFMRPMLGIGPNGDPNNTAFEEAVFNNYLPDTILNNTLDFVGDLTSTKSNKPPVQGPGTQDTFWEDFTAQLNAEHAPGEWKGARISTPSATLPGAVHMSSPTDNRAQFKALLDQKEQYAPPDYTQEEQDSTMYNNIMQGMAAGTLDAINSRGDIGEALLRTALGVASGKARGQAEVDDKMAASRIAKNAFALDRISDEATYLRNSAAYDQQLARVEFENAQEDRNAIMAQLQLDETTVKTNPDGSVTTSRVDIDPVTGQRSRITEVTDPTGMAAKIQRIKHMQTYAKLGGGLASLAGKKKISTFDAKLVIATEAVENTPDLSLLLGPEIGGGLEKEIQDMMGAKRDAIPAAEFAKHYKAAQIYKLIEVINGAKRQGSNDLPFWKNLYGLGVGRN